MSDLTQAAFEKFKALPIEKLNELFADDNKAALLALRQKNRPAYEDLFDSWKRNGWRNAHVLKREVEALVRQVGKTKGQLDPEVPMQSARRFRDDVHPTLIRYEDDWLVHRSSHYEVISADQVRSDVFVYLDEVGDFSPTSKSVSNVVDALGAVCLVERGRFAPPCWLDEGHEDYPADEILACRNGLLHIPSGELLPSTPQFFTRNGLPYDYDPDAPAPKRWLQFCAEVWEHDPEQIELLQEVFGYLLTPDTRCRNSL